MTRRRPGSALGRVPSRQASDPDVPSLPAKRGPSRNAARVSLLRYI
eukprot:CAMPEP_0181251254 /NCGR_PEP_ID=MMETSP1096-20121128/46778_1 /TAXON_ID=156174 ORGANISM="Chrysochromulina ericina, Strain CCMP281" /NCGR_SAMPLE_ID=MMETSP1096 /ASSEMBLY_ACC=CAM_ASM_000453 /LENGTH=45 /DNA_ID= /DNA_START= /DNA_END= /DNA_ORIENTATION=